MTQPEVPDRRPLLYVIMGVVILGIAVVLFWPQGDGARDGLPRARRNLEDPKLRSCTGFPNRSPWPVARAEEEVDLAGPTETEWQGPTLAGGERPTLIRTGGGAHAWKRFP